MRWRFLLLVFGLSLIVFGGVQEIELWRVAKSTPQELTYRQLATDGPGNNSHIMLRGFYLCVDAFVYEERGGRWTVAWVPAVAKGTELGPNGRPRGDDVSVLVKMPRARSMADVVHAAESPVLQGMVTNTIERLGPDEAAMLARSYPDVDFERCRIFEVDREPSGLWPVLGSLVGGGLLIAYMLWTLLAGQGTVVHGPLPTATATGSTASPAPPAKASPRPQPPLPSPRAGWSNPDRP